MWGRIIRHLRANVIAYLALFVALGWTGAYAAQKVGKNTVKSKQIKDGQVKTQDLASGAVSGSKLAPGAVTPQTIDDGSITGAKLADGAVTGAKVADNSLTGADVDETSLMGVNAANVGGMQVKKINFQVPFGTPIQNVLVYPDIFRIDAQCANNGDFLDISAATAFDNSAVSLTAQDALASDDRTSDASRDIAARSDDDFDKNEAFEVDNIPELTGFNDLTMEYSNPNNFAATIHLRTEINTSGCKLTGISVGG